MDLHDLREHLDGRLDSVRDDMVRIEGKLDNHLERISKAETSIEWIRGHLRISVTILIAALTGLAGALYNYVISGR